MATARALRLATLVVPALGAALLHVEPAAATTCIGVDPRETLARADAAFIGQLVATRSVSGPQYPIGRAEILTFRVHETVKGNLRELVEVRDAYPPSPTPRPPGIVTGVFLYAVEGGFGVGLCNGYISPEWLRAAQRGGRIVKEASDVRADMSFRLERRRLTVRVGRYPPRRVRRALRRRIELVCGNHVEFHSDFPERLGPRYPLATAKGRFRQGQRKLTVVLNGDVSRAATSCGARQAAGRRRIVAAVFFPPDFGA